MRFRPVIGYLILTVATIILSLATLRLATHQDLASVFFLGSLLGIVVGFFMFRHSWHVIQQLVAKRTQMKLQEGKELLGHRLYRWVFEVWIAFIVLVVLVLPEDVSGFIRSLTTFISGGFSGAIFTYFLALTILTLREERRLKRRIVITLE